jgi:hypothetical protein
VVTIICKPGGGSSVQDGIVGILTRQAYSAFLLGRRQCQQGECRQPMLAHIVAGEVG